MALWVTTFGINRKPVIACDLDLSFSSIKKRKKEKDRLFPFQLRIFRYLFDTSVDSYSYVF